MYDLDLVSIVLMMQKNEESLLDSWLEAHQEDDLSRTVVLLMGVD
jgi:hypothetical protein